MAPSKKKLKPFDLSGIQTKPPWAHGKNLSSSGANNTESDLPSPRKVHSKVANGTSRESPSKTVKKIMTMRNGDPYTKHMILVNRNKIPSFEAFLADIGESFQLPTQKLFTSDGQKVRQLHYLYKFKFN